MATSTLYQGSPLGSPSSSPRSCLYLSRPKADWRASFTNSESLRGSQTLPLILRHHDGVWLSSTSSTFNSNKEPSPQPQPQPERQPTPPEETNNSTIHIPRGKLNLNPVSKILRCYVCQTLTKEEYFHHHLFFGMVHCDLCNLACRDCRTFSQLTVGVSSNRSSCQHSFSFSKDPYEYLLLHVSGSDDNNVGSSLALPNKLRLVQQYVNQLVHVQLQEPWCSAIRQCKSRLLKSHTPTPPETSKNMELPKDPVDSIGAEDSGNSSPATERIPSPAIMQHKSQEERNVDDGLLLSQTYDLQHLEQTVEYVEVDKQWQMDGVKDQELQNKPKKRRKTSPYKKAKGHRLTTQKRRRPPTLLEGEANGVNETDLVLEEVALPQDGYYLMVQEVIEECPMCYTSLSPDLCSINLNTFLITITCPECSLLIFIVPDLPGGLHIVTDSRAGNAVKETKLDHTKPRKIQPRDFFAK